MSEWRNYCKEREENDPFDESTHCFHRTGVVVNGFAEEVCCFCGDLFVSPDREPFEHGSYVPEEGVANMATSTKAKTNPAKKTTADDKKPVKATVRKVIEANVESIQKDLLRAYFQDMKVSFSRKYATATNLQKLLDPSSTKNKALYKKIAETIPKKTYTININEFDRQIILDKIDGSCIGDDLIKHLKAALKEPVEEGVKADVEE